jgi:hypothetical protein
MGKAKPKNWVVGRWLIDSMDQWDRNFIDEEVRGYFEFDAKDSGEFQFGYVQGQIDYRLGERDGKPAVEFTWDGNDEMDPALGRGTLYIHLGDESGIVLKREPEKKAKTARKRKR